MGRPDGNEPITLQSNADKDVLKIIGLQRLKCYNGYVLFFKAHFFFHIHNIASCKFIIFVNYYCFFLIFINVSLHSILMLLINYVEEVLCCRYSYNFNYKFVLFMMFGKIF